MCTIFLSKDAFKRADKLARGRYQTDLLRSNACWSGADLRGKAREYAGRYAVSRENLLYRLTQNGLPNQTVYLKHNRKTVLVGEDEGMVQSIAKQLIDPEQKIGAQAALRLIGIEVEV